MTTTKPVSALRRELLGAGVILALVGIWMLFVRRPESNWFYVIIALALGLSAYRSSRGDFTPATPTDPPKEVRVALTEGIFSGISAAIVFFAVMLSMSAEWNQWVSAAAFGIFLGVFRYRWERGRRTPWVWLTVMIVAAFVLVNVFVVLKLNSKH